MSTLILYEDVTDAVTRRSISSVSGSASDPAGDLLYLNQRLCRALHGLRYGSDQSRSRSCYQRDATGQSVVPYLEAYLMSDELGIPRSARSTRTSIQLFLHLYSPTTLVLPPPNAPHTVSHPRPYLRDRRSQHANLRRIGFCLFGFFRRRSRRRIESHSARNAWGWKGETGGRDSERRGDFIHHLGSNG